VALKEVHHRLRRSRGDLWLTVRAVAAPFDQAHLGSRYRPSYRIELAGLGAGIAIAVQHEYRSLDLAQPAIEEIAVRVRSVLDRSPDGTLAP
jgi:hypothetical protein